MRPALSKLWWKMQNKLWYLFSRTWRASSRVVWHAGTQNSAISRIIARVLTGIRYLDGFRRKACTCSFAVSVDYVSMVHILVIDVLPCFSSCSSSLIASHFVRNVSTIKIKSKHRDHSCKGLPLLGFLFAPLVFTCPGSFVASSFVSFFTAALWEAASL